ncbi:MAG: S8 family serine peptidase [Chitinispirillaceae bacterium]|nr:S8 family serine peptidase [Chitinispirillaceae bacterium]
MKKHFTIWIAISLHLLLLQTFAEQTSSQFPHPGDYVKNECLIKFLPGTDKTVIDSISSRSKFTVLAYYPHGRFFRVRLISSQNILAFSKQLTQYSEVELAQPDYFTSTSIYTTDSLVPAYLNTGNTVSTKVNLPLSLDTSRPALADIITAIIDGGVAFENYQNYKKAQALSHARFSKGYNFVLFNEHPIDDNGNGTLAATIIANHIKNTSDSLSSEKNTSIMPVKVTDKDGIGRTSTLVEGILYAVIGGADILTINARSHDSPLLKQAIIQAHNHGVTIICAAGNIISPEQHTFPAAYNQYCIAVSATSVPPVQASSVPNADYIDLNTSGEILYQNPDPYGFSTVQGVTVATAQVAATAVSLMLSGINGSDRIRQALEQTCLDIPPRGWDRQTGWGTLDIHKALQFFPKPEHDLQVSNIKVSPWCIKGERLQTITTVENQGTFEHEFLISLSDSKSSRILASGSGSLKPQQTGQFVLEWNTAQATEGTHLLCVSATIPGDEDPADNMLYTKVFVAEDKRDVEISGVELKKQPEKNSFLATVQIKNSGTYNEIINVQVRNQSGALLGQKNIQICAQCIMFLPVQCQFETDTALKELEISIETADLQECNLTNNRVTCPITFSE